MIMSNGRCWHSLEPEVVDGLITEPAAASQSDPGGNLHVPPNCSSPLLLILFFIRVPYYPFILPLTFLPLKYMSGIIQFRNVTAMFQRTSRLRPERAFLWAFLSQNFNTDETKLFLKVFRGFIIPKQWNFNFLLIPNRQASNRPALQGHHNTFSLSFGTKGKGHTP